MSGCVSVNGVFEILGKAGEPGRAEINIYISRGESMAYDHPYCSWWCVHFPLWLEC